MRRVLKVVIVALGLAAAGAAPAQLSPPNAAGVAMGHLHYVVRDVAANKAFWVALGGRSVLFNGITEGIVFPDVVVLLRQGEPSGGTQGSVVNHVAFRVKSVAEIEKAGFTVEYNEQYPVSRPCTRPRASASSYSTTRSRRTWASRSTTVVATPPPSGTTASSRCRSSRITFISTCPRIKSHRPRNGMRRTSAACVASAGATTPSTYPASTSTSRPSTRHSCRRAAGCSITSDSR